MEKKESSDKSDRPNSQGFLVTLLQGLIRDTIGLWIAVLIGTIIGAVICLYFGIPLIFSLVGGVLVMAVYVAWDKL